MADSILQSFAFGDRNVRTAQHEDGSIWFCLGDVLGAMGTSVDASKAKATLEEHLGDGTTIVLPILDALGRTQETLFVSEPGVTFLLSRSRSKAGKSLNKFIHCEVLPSIRKTGNYTTKQTEADRVSLEQKMLPKPGIKDLGEAAKFFEAIKLPPEYIQRWGLQQMQKHYPEMAGDAPKAIEMASLPTAKALLTPTQVAETLGILHSTGKGNAIKVNKLLETLGYQQQIAGRWSATDKAIQSDLVDRKPVNTNSRHPKRPASLVCRHHSHPARTRSFLATKNTAPRICILGAVFLLSGDRLKFFSKAIALVKLTVQLCKGRN